MTLMPVSRICGFGSSSSNGGGSRWIGQRSVSAASAGACSGSSLSIGWPSTLKMRPSVTLPTGTVIGPPVSTTIVPRARPSVGVHRDRAHAVVAQVLLHLRDQGAALARVDRGARSRCPEGAPRTTASSTTPWISTILPTFCRLPCGSTCSLRRGRKAALARPFPAARRHEAEPIRETRCALRCHDRVAIETRPGCRQRGLTVAAGRDAIAAALLGPLQRVIGSPLQVARLVRPGEHADADGDRRRLDARDAHRDNGPRARSAAARHGGSAAGTVRRSASPPTAPAARPRAGGPQRQRRRTASGRRLRWHRGR